MTPKAAEVSPVVTTSKDIVKRFTMVKDSSSMTVLKFNGSVLPVVKRKDDSANVAAVTATENMVRFDARLVSSSCANANG